jgi:25S rRNA (adenine2142-N1)-methyltransferase
MAKTPTALRKSNKKRGRPVLLAPSVKLDVMKSRKRARQVTTLFHKLTRERDLALQKGETEEAQKCEQRLEEMGGREKYQRASQLSTSFHSTSKWVLGQLASRGWLYGIVVEENDGDDETINFGEDEENSQRGRPASSIVTAKRKRSSRKSRRTTRILEVGAINTELLDFAGQQSEGSNQDVTKDRLNNNGKRYNVHVRAIDIHSMAKGRIEEADFLELPFLDSNPTLRYDVVVCSMVLNSVTNATDRGKMLALLYHHLRPGGLCFFTIPKFCLTKSAFLTPHLFSTLLGKSGVGFDVISTKESPRVSFFVLQKPEGFKQRTTGLDPKWTKQVVRNKGKKFPNQFSVVLKKEHVFGEKFG